MATVETTRLPAVSLPRTRLADYFELSKPKIGAMALVTVAVGYLLGAAPGFRADHLLHTLVGAGLVAAGGSYLNCWLERRADAKMRRTAERALPAGRVSPAEAFALGLVLAFGGVAYLAYTLPTPAAAIVAALTFTLYVGVYTPLKRVTTWNTVVGAVPGALPPLIGWCAANGTVVAEGWVLFAILFVWQLPHFYSIAWLYRDDYARGGMRMLPVADHADGRLTGWATALTAGVLLAVTAAPFAIGAAGWLYLAGAMPLGAWFLARCVRFARVRSQQTARTVLRGSLVYLLGVMGLLVVDGVLPRYFS
ncbi:MAG TPA: heme o synthase [Fimbriiglobus sp.]|nr:heme o synthase [Fimbriiglobus sp.]